MRWEIIDKSPKKGDIRFRTRFAFFPTKVVSKITMSDHIIWLELYLEEQEYTIDHGWAGTDRYWRTVAKTIHI